MNDLIEKAESLQNLLVARATGTVERPSDYVTLRASLTGDARLKAHVPDFVRTCRSLDQFWQLIKHKFDNYADRRKYLYDEFRPLFDHLERGQNPSIESVDDALMRFDAEHVHSAWTKALDRRDSDPEGAITAARTLLESVCKHILDDLGVVYDEGLELPKLYKLMAKHLKLAPEQHTEEVFKQILGGCASVVEGIGSVRNKLSDAHGRGRIHVKPAARHAELAVNLAGALSIFLVATAAVRKESEANVGQKSS
jgi:hypothetical protein